jgi:acylglycerol lipase
MGHGAHLAKYFSERGIETVGFDYRGFGRSEGREGYVESREAHLKDSRKFVDEVAPFYKGVPRFALGLSLGGMTIYYLTLDNPNLFDGVVLMAPALKASFGTKVVKFAKVLGSILPNKMRLAKPVYGKATKNPVITEFVKKDKFAFS